MNTIFQSICNNLADLFKAILFSLNTTVVTFLYLKLLCVYVCVSVCVRERERKRKEREREKREREIVQQAHC